MFQLIYLRFTQPRADAERVRRAGGADEGAAGEPERDSPSSLRRDADRRRMTQNHLRRRMLTPELVDQWNLDKSLAFYKDRFADASDFTFVFVGKLRSGDDEAAGRDSTSAACRRPGRKETWKDVGVRPPTGVDREDGREGHRAEEPGRRSSSPGRSSTTRRSASRSARWRQMLQTRLLRDDPRGTRRHLQHHRQPELQQAPRSRILRVASVRLRPAAQRRSGQARASGDRGVQARGSHREAGERRERSAAARI